MTELSEDIGTFAPAAHGRIEAPAPKELDQGITILVEHWFEGQAAEAHKTCCGGNRRGGCRRSAGSMMECISTSITGQAVHLINVRTQRNRPGLRPQHLRALQACAHLCQGQLSQDHVGSEEFVFIPQGSIQGGEHHFDVGTAGSTTMLALTILPLGLFADQPCRFILRGGLFQDFAPSALYMEQVLLPALRPMGIQSGIEIYRPGYVPSGQGCLECTVQPLKERPRSLNFLEFGRLEMMGGIALSSHLKHRKVSERMRRACQKRLHSQGLSVQIQESYDTSQEPVYREAAKQAGACLAVWAATDTGCILGSDMAGAPGRPAEEIGRKVANHLLEDLSAGATVDRFLADQLIPFAALAKGESRYRIPFLTDHVQTRLWLARELLGAKTAICGQEVRITGIG